MRARTLDTMKAILSAAIGAAAVGCSCPLPRADVVETTPRPLVDVPERLAIECSVRCQGEGGRCKATQLPDGTPALTCEYDIEPMEPCGAGRKPRGLLAPRRRRSRSSSGAVLARAAHLEAASVVAFEELARSLASFGAPVDLVQRARLAAKEEARHAEVVGRLALRRGDRPRPVRRRSTARPSLLELAIHNAREGCAAETLAAAIAMVQARTAADQDVRSAMVSIAEEEASHAALAYAVDDWARTKLSDLERARLDRAHRSAWRALTVRADAGPPIVELGIPSGAFRARLATELARQS